MQNWLYDDLWLMPWLYLCHHTLFPTKRAILSVRMSVLLVYLGTIGPKPKVPAEGLYKGALGVCYPSRCFNALHAFGALGDCCSGNIDLITSNTRNTAQVLSFYTSLNNYCAKTVSTGCCSHWVTKFGSCRTTDQADSTR